VIRNIDLQRITNVPKSNSKQQNMKFKQCKALFSISEPLIGHDSYFNNANGNIISNKSESLDTIIEKIRSNRQSAFGPDTTDYKKLSSWLPSLLKTKNENGSVALSKRTRVEQNDGYLPHVPCQQVLYTPSTAFSCVRDRLKTKQHFRLTFMGDSKIRNLFQGFLATTINFDYEIYQNNSTMTLEDMLKSLRYPKTRWIDRKASSKLLQGFSVFYKYEPFNEDTPEEYNNMEGVKLIKSWLSGEASPPDLVVIGYTSWMLQKMEVVRDENLSILQMEDYLMDIHRFLVPLLEALGHKTRVLVEAQSRLRPNANFATIIRPAQYSDANVEWSEKMFLHYIKRTYIGDRDPLIPDAGNTDPLVPAVGNTGVWWWDSSLPLNMATVRECTLLYDSNLGKTAEYNATWLKCLDMAHAGQA
ncbi:unnamed protein product, partial [Meganyctiphanes norvegica]